MKPNQVIFGVSPTLEGGTDVLLGVSPEAWEFMKDGHTHTFDLTSLGVPIRIILCGGPDQETILKWVAEHNKKHGPSTTLDLRDQDFSVQPKDPPLPTDRGLGKKRLRHHDDPDADPQ